jgi:hypothetical protein
MEKTLKSTLCVAGAIIAAIGVTPAFADGSKSHSRCWWQQGVFVCKSTYEDDYSKTSMLCGSGGIDGECKTVTKLKEQPKPEPVYTPPDNGFVPFDADAMERAHQREAENAKKGHFGVVVCGPDHWVKDHWEPSCR